MSRKSIICLVLALLSGLLSACVVSQSSSIEERGQQVGQSTLEQLENGVTTRAWVRAVLGEPTQRKMFAGDREIWIYEYVQKKTNRVGVIVLLGSQSEEIEKETAYLEFEDGTLTKHWIER